MLLASPLLSAMVSASAYFPIFFKSVFMYISSANFSLSPDMLRTHAVNISYFHPFSSTNGLLKRNFGDAAKWDFCYFQRQMRMSL